MGRVGAERIELVVKQALLRSALPDGTVVLLVVLHDDHCAILRNDELVHEAGGDADGIDDAVQRFMAMTQVHENHIYVAVPLLVIVAATRPAYRPLMWTVSAIFFLNLNLFYGISEYAYRGQYIIPRHITVIDLTVVVSVVNCLALAWHGTLLRRECAVESEARPATLAA